MREPEQHQAGTWAPDALQPLLRRLRAAYGIDFAEYRDSTVNRCVERRMLRRPVRDLADYIAAIEADAGELEALYRDLLIGVTQFFRDPEAFKALQEQALPQLLTPAALEDGLRVWVAGCGTGEEAYSLAILLHEAIGESRGLANCLIFATDVHRESLEFAAHGLYAEPSVTGVAPALLDRYFAREGARYRILPEIRRHVVFAPQDVLKDPPFPEMDLVACRNLLIYLRPAAQQKVLGKIRSALKPGGILFLGPAETAEDLETVDAQWKIYRGHEKPPTEREQQLAHDMENLLRSTDIGTVFLDAQSRLRRMTPAMGRWFAISAQDQGRAAAEVLAGLRHEGLGADLRQVAEIGSVIEREVQTHQGDWLLMRIQPYRTERGVPDGAVLTFTEVSTLRRAQEALLQSESHFRELAEFINAIFWLTSPDGRFIVYVSPGYERMWQRSLESLCTNPRAWLEAIHSDDRERVERTIAARAPDGGWEAQYRIVHPNGTVRWIRDRRYPVHDADGRLYRLAGITVDITSLKNSERTLEFTQFAVEHAGDLVFWMTPDARFQYVNEAACAQLGYSRDELLKMSLPDIDLVRNADVWPRYVKELMEAGRRTFESVLLARDGRKIPVEISSTCLRFGNEMYCCSIARDISARREAARELERYAAELERANESLRHRNRELDEFAHLASHDLKEPLRAILTFSQLLDQDLGGRLPGDARRDLEFITNSAGRMQRLINDLLALSRAGRVDMRQSAVPLRRCVDTALETLAVRIAETGAVIVIGELPEITGDATMITQLYQNLAGNALKFIAPGRPPRVRITAEQRDGGWLFSVEDNGLGIKPEYLEKIFQPFRRLHAGPEHEGTGIGLAICRKVVERHGGRIWADSHPGEGSTFHFTIGEAASG